MNVPLLFLSQSITSLLQKIVGLGLSVARAAVLLILLAAQAFGVHGLLGAVGRLRAVLLQCEGEMARKGSTRQGHACLHGESCWFPVGW
jgi:hypothetical protein